ncbi:DUF397 domain-containing protein [Streptomyces sp. NPDC002520]
MSAGTSSQLAWFKSSYSSGNDGNSCVEIATTSGTIHIRDSKHTEGPQLAVAPEPWAAFVAGVVRT